MTQSASQTGPRPRVLFLCTGNSCRSQMAEGWLRHLTAGRIEASSAGTAPVDIHPEALAVMREAGVDLSSQSSTHVNEFLGQPPELVISVCAAAEAACPAFPGATPRLHWPFDDPAGFVGDGEAKRAEFRRVRDQIRARIEDWLEEGLPPLG